jgi:Tfp pilus assembly protein PilO
MNDKKILISLISAGVGVALILFAIIPFWNSIGTIRAEIKEKEKRISELKDLIEKVEGLEDEYQNLKSKQEKLNQAVPDKKRTSHLLTQLEEMAFSNGLLLNDISFKEKQSSGLTSQTPQQIEEKKKDLPGGASKMRVDINLSGSYGALKNFFKALEKNIRTMDVRSFNIGTTGEGSVEPGSGSLLRTKMSFDVYYVDSE